MAKTVQVGMRSRCSSVLFPDSVATIAVPKEQTWLANATQAAIKKIIASGKHGQITRKWGVTSAPFPSGKILIDGGGQGTSARYVTS